MLFVVFFGAGSVAGAAVATVFCSTVGLDQENRGGAGG